MDDKDPRFPLWHLLGLFKAVQLGLIPAEAAASAQVFHEHDCGAMYDLLTPIRAPVCTCQPRVKIGLAEDPRIGIAQLDGAITVITEH